MINKTLQATIGASNLETDLLNFLADTLTNNDPEWMSEKGDGSGAWGVSQKWYGVVTPRESVSLQAAQALNVLREITVNLGPIDDWPGLVCYYSAVLRLWWYPGDAILIRDHYEDYRKYPTMADLGWDNRAASNWVGIAPDLITSAKKHWMLLAGGLVLLVVGLWFLTKGK